MEELPLEIWFLITESFSSDDLYKLIGINKFFFELGMNRRYHEITLDTGDRRIRSQLSHVNEPGIASRIKNLILHIHPISEARGPSRIPQASAGASTSQRTSLAGSVRNALNRVIPSLSRPASATTGIPELGPMDVKAMVGKLIKILPLMTGVEYFRIVTWALPSLTDLRLDELYHRAWSVFGTTLRRISICANLAGYRSLLESNPSFPSLEILELEFSDSIFIASGPTEPQVLVTHIVPFINALSPQIKTLKIRSFAKLDLSALFTNITPFTSLESTLIRIPFNTGLRQDPSGLRKYLIHSSTTLEKVVIRLTPMGLALDPTVEEPLYQWFFNCVSDPICFSKVHTLDICPTNLPDGMRILYQCISHAFTQLTSIIVRDRYLQKEEAVAVSVKLAKCERLTSLRVNIVTLSCDVFDAFARNLPSLRYLWLSVGEPASTDLTVPGTSSELFRKSMKDRRYTGWNLWDLTIWQGGNELDDKTMLSFKRSIPSVKSFWGTGHTRLSDGT